MDPCNTVVSTHELVVFEQIEDINLSHAAVTVKTGSHYSPENSEQRVARERLEPRFAEVDFWLSGSSTRRTGAACLNRLQLLAVATRTCRPLPDSKRHSPETVYGRRAY